MNETKLLDATADKSCDNCVFQEGRHYCLLHTTQVKNMDATRCPSWSAREDDESMKNENDEFAAKLLMRDRETGEELRTSSIPHDNGDGSYTIFVANAAGDRKWKHTIRTEEA